MENEGGTVPAEVPAKSSRWLVAAAGAAFVLIAVIAAVFVFGLAGHSCNCGPFPRISATVEGDTVVVTYNGVWSDREGAWFPKRLPDEERLLTGFHFFVKSSNGTESWQNLSAPGPGQDEAVRFGHAATDGRDWVFVTADYTDGTTNVVYDNYV